MDYPTDSFMAGNIKKLQRKRAQSIEWLTEQLGNAEKAEAFVDDVLFAAISETNDYHRRRATLETLNPRGVASSIAFGTDSEYRDEVSND